MRVSNVKNAIGGKKMISDKKQKGREETSSDKNCTFRPFYHFAFKPSIGHISYSYAKINCVLAKNRPGGLMVKDGCLE
jgi:hypothetical protein